MEFKDYVLIVSFILNLVSFGFYIFVLSPIKKILKDHNNRTNIVRVLRSYNITSARTKPTQSKTKTRHDLLNKKGVMSINFEIVNDTIKNIDYLHLPTNSVLLKFSAEAYEDTNFFIDSINDYLTDVQSK